MSTSGLSTGGKWLASSITTNVAAGVRLVMYGGSVWETARAYPRATLLSSQQGALQDREVEWLDQMQIEACGQRTESIAFLPIPRGCHQQQ